MNNFVIEHLIWQETTIPNLTEKIPLVLSIVSNLSRSQVLVLCLPKEPTYNMQFSCPYRWIPVAVKFRYSEKAISSYMYCCHRIVAWIIHSLSNNISLLSRSNSVWGLSSWTESRFLLKNIKRQTFFWFYFEWLSHALSKMMILHTDCTGF